MSKYILSLDAGTTSSRAIVFDQSGNIKSVAQKEFEQIFPKPGWVEHDANEIWKTQLEVARSAIEQSGANAGDMAAIGITNQRETAILWDRSTGKPVHNAIVWQDRRTADYCRQMSTAENVETVKSKTGLVIDAYFSATKVRWMLQENPGLRQRAEAGEIAFGTVDSWLIWNLTGGQKHVTDVTNASRTLLYNIVDLTWDEKLLDLFEIPAAILPDVKDSSEIYGHTTIDVLGAEIPVSGIAGDQQAALLGQMCVNPGMIKNTYGTGCFVIMNTGGKVVRSPNNLLTTIAWKIGDRVDYALEGSIFVGGAVVQWLRDQLGIIESSSDVEALASSVSDNGGIAFVPAFAGLGAPIWDGYARGAILGMTRGTNKAHIARAALEGIALRSLDVMTTMKEDSGSEILELRVDGGASVNDLLMQFQADVLQTMVIRPKITETTALGAAYLAGIAVGYWSGLDEAGRHWQEDARFTPGDYSKVEKTVRNWQKALEKAGGWEEEALI